MYVCRLSGATYIPAPPCSLVKTGDHVETWRRNDGNIHSVYTRAVYRSKYNIVNSYYYTVHL